LSIRGAATIEDVIASVQETFPDTYTRASLSRAADILIMRNLICQKTDISTYARQQNSAILSESISHRPTSRGRGRGRGRGGRGTGRGTGRETGRGTGRVTAEAEEDLTAGKRRARSLGAQIMEMQVKKAKME
jgi:singapore isolate B (sub-type 7) whole genome shotgun sequence assembly, scaffold_20